MKKARLSKPLEVTVAEPVRRGTAWKAATARLKAGLGWVCGWAWAAQDSGCFHHIPLSPRFSSEIHTYTTININKVPEKLLNHSERHISLLFLITPSPTSTLKFLKLKLHYSNVQGRKVFSTRVKNPCTRLWGKCSKRVMEAYTSLVCNKPTVGLSTLLLQIRKLLIDAREKWLWLQIQETRTR